MAAADGADEPLVIGGPERPLLGLDSAFVEEIFVYMLSSLDPEAALVGSAAGGQNPAAYSLFTG